MRVVSRWQVFEGAVNDVIVDESGATLVAATTSAYDAESKKYSSNELASLDGEWRKRSGTGPLAFCSRGRGVIARVREGREWVSQRLSVPALESLGDPGMNMSAVAAGMMDATMVRARYWQKEVRGGAVDVYSLDAASGFLPQMEPAEVTMRAAISADGSFAVAELVGRDAVQGYAISSGVAHLKWSLDVGRGLRFTGSTVALSARGTRGLAVDGSGVLVFSRSGQRLGLLDDVQGSVLAWSSGDRIAVGGAGKVWVADLEFASATAAPLIRQSWSLSLGTEESPAAVSALGFSGDKKKLAVGTSDGAVSLCAIED